MGKIEKTKKVLFFYRDIDILNQISDIKIKKIKRDISLSREIQGEVFNCNCEAIAKLEEEKNNRLLIKEIVGSSLNILEYDEREIIELRYFSKSTKEWNEIALEVGISSDYCIKKIKKH